MPMPRFLLFLLVFIPLALIGSALGWPAGILFFLSLGAVIPLAGAIGTATDQAAMTSGPRIGGLLNATFGNVPDLLVGYFGIQSGLFAFVKATLIGAIISNTGLIVGLSFLVAGLRHGFVRFNARQAGGHTVLMLLAVAAMLFPTITAITVQPALAPEGLSVGVAIILLLAYLAYVTFSIFNVVGGDPPLGAPGVAGAVITSEAEILEPSGPHWPLWLSVGVLLASAAVLIPITDILVAALMPAITALGWTSAFAGVILVANAGNASEMYSAVRMAGKRRLDLSLEIASGSSIQIATLIAPIIVLLSLTKYPMDLTFSPLELAIVGLVVAIFAYVAHDGETNWLEGFQLLAIYAMAAAVFYVLPRV